MKQNDYLELITNIVNEVNKVPLSHRILRLQKASDDFPPVSDKLEKLTTVYNNLSPHPDLSEDQTTMMMCTFKHLDLITKAYAKRRANTQNYPSWQQDNNTDDIWSDTNISDGYLTFKTKDGKTKTSYYSKVSLHALQNLTPWVFKTNTYSATIDQLDFSTGVTINKLVEDIIGMVSSGSSIKIIMDSFLKAEKNENVKDVLKFSLEYKKKVSTERLFQISPLGNFNGMLSFVATYFITEEKSKDFNSIFDLTFRKKSQMYAAEGVLVHYDQLTWNNYANQIIAATNKDKEKEIAMTLSLYD